MSASWKCQHLCGVSGVAFPRLTANRRATVYRIAAAHVCSAVADHVTRTVCCSPRCCCSSRSRRRRKSTSPSGWAGAPRPRRSSRRSTTRASDRRSASCGTRRRARRSISPIRYVEQYPRSIVLREAYELAARAYIAEGDLARGLTWAQRALRLMPENPFLLVAVADTAAKQRDLDLAVTSARDALRYLEHAERPSHFSPQAWPRVA